MTTTSSAVASGAATGKLALQVQPPDAQEFVQESPTPLIPGSFDDSFPSSASSTGQEFANSINNSGTTDGAPNRKAAGMSRSLRISVSPITSTDYRTSAPISPGSILDLYTRSPTSDARCSASLSASPGQPTVTSSSGESLRQGHQSSESTPMPPPADASESAQRDQKMSVPIGQVVVDACADGNQATVPALAPASGPTRSDIWPSYADNGVRACKTSDSSAAAGGAGLMTGTGSWPLAGAVNAGAGKSSSRRPNYVQGSPSIRAHPMMNTNNSNTHATGGGGSCGSPQAPFGFTQPPLPSPRSRSSTNNFGSGVAAPVSHSLNEQDSATSAQSEDASASFAARAGATSLTEAGSSSSTVNVASDIKNVATTSKTTSSPSKRDDGIVDPASLSIAAVQQLPELGIAHPQKRPASGSDIYPVSEDSAHAMWSQYQDQFELTDGNNDIDDPKRAAAKPSTIRSLTLGSAAADSSEQHKISQRSCMLAEVYDPFSTTTAPGTTAPVAPAGSPSYYEIPAVYQAKAITDINAPAPPASTSDSAAEGTDKETDGASDAFSASQEAPHIPHRVSSSFQGGVPPAATRTADASTSVVDPPSSTAAHHVPLKAASPLAQAIPFEDVYMDAGSVIIPSRSDSGGSDDLGHLDPKMGGVDPAMLESSVAISASNTASALTTTLTSAPSAAPRATTAVRLEQGQERTSGGIDASDSSDYGSDAHEETLQRPPRRNRLREGSDNQLPVGPQRPSSTLITTAVGDYLEDKMEISAPSEFSSAPSDGDLTAEQQAQLEARLEKEADEMDPSRPRTLQEARALARERARLRQQQAALPEGTPEVVAAVSPQMRPKRDPRRGTAESQVVNSTSMLHHSSEMPIQNSRAVLEGSSQPGSGGLTLDSIPSRSAENGALSTSLRDKRKGQVSPVLPQKQTVSPISGIKDLQAAVSASMNDISFGSTVEAVSQGCAAPQTQHSPTASRGVLTPRQSSLAQLPQTSSSQPSFSGNTHSNSVTPRIEHVPAFDFRLGPMGGPSLAVDSHFAEQPVYPTPLVTVGRIEIYGKTLPWPAAFDSSKIIEKKRNAAWDRAKLYAIATNQLLTTPTNLATWVEVKNRPTAKLAANSAHSYRRQARQEASYAASIRSDMTFPMRGDGGKAKEITSVPTVSLSSVSEIPTNIPYPGVMQQDYGTATRSSMERPSFENSERVRQTPSNMSGAGGFLGGLTRRASRRSESYPAGLLPLSKTIPGGIRGGSKPTISSPSGPVVLLGQHGHMSASNLLNMSQRDQPAPLQQQHNPSRTGTMPVAGPRVPRSGRSPSPTKSAVMRTAYIQRVEQAPPSPITSMSPPSAAGSMYSDIPRSPGLRGTAALNGDSDHSLNALVPPPYGANSISGSLSKGARSSLSYGSVRGKSYSPSNDDPGFKEALDKIADVLPDADRNMLSAYLHKTNGDDLAAISAYLQDAADGKVHSR